MENTGFINDIEIYNVFKIVCRSRDEKNRLRKYCKEILENVNERWDKIPKGKFFDIAKEYIQLTNLLQESIRSIRKVDKIIENDVAEHFQTWIP